MGVAQVSRGSAGIDLAAIDEDGQGIAPGAEVIQFQDYFADAGRVLQFVFDPGGGEGSVVMPVRGFVVVIGEAGVGPRSSRAGRPASGICRASPLVTAKGFASKVRMAGERSFVVAFRVI